MKFTDDIGCKRSLNTLYDLTGRYKEIQELCRKFAENELTSVAGKLDKDQKFPSNEVRRLFELGLMGICASKKYGGSEYDCLGLSIAIEELSKGCSSIGTICSIHNALSVNLLEKTGTERQKDKYLKSFVNDSLGFFALSEADAGSDVVAISTEARKDGDFYILNGSKAWVTSALDSNAGIVFATIDKSKGHSGITAFIIETNTPGVKISENIQKLGLRATSMSNLYLTDVKVPKSNIIGNVGEGFKLAMNQLEQARIGKASVGVGIASKSLEIAINYASNRYQFNQSLLSMPTVKTRLAEMSAGLESARLLTRTAAIQRDNAGSATKLSSLAKYVASETATFCTHNCIQIMGGMGIVNSEPAERLYRDARIVEVLGGVTDIQKLVVADQLVKEYGLNRIRILEMVLCDNIIIEFDQIIHLIDSNFDAHH
uniref:Short-chain specific acyl-CoA dehydrogenase, mitochondrial n=1 Tax=Culicoides sonorensis TaxID=179676 RepID=A0A336M4H2_CULSO